MQTKILSFVTRSVLCGNIQDHIYEFCFTIQFMQDNQKIDSDIFQDYFHTNGSFCILTQT